MVTVAAVACGGGGDQGTPDGAVDATQMTDAPPDANLDVAGSWIDRYITESGTSMVPMCTVAPNGVVIDTTTGGTTLHPGACKADGTFRIMPAANLGTYYLRLGSSYYETNKRMGIDFSTDHLGRADVVPVAGVVLNLSLTNLEPWEVGDTIYAFSSNIGYSQVVSFTSGAPSNNATTITGTAPWSGFKIESNKLDTLTLLQVGAHTTGGGLGYTSLDRVFGAAPFTMGTGTPSTISGAFTTPTASSLQLRVDSSGFNQFATVANPNATTKTMDGSLTATVSADAKGAPALLSFGAPTNGVTSLDFGTLAFGDPFPTTWQRLMRVQAVFQVPYSFAGITTNRGATMTRLVPYATANTTTLDAVLGPPTGPMFDDVNAHTATEISLVPRLAWFPPTLGTPTDYEVQVYEVSVNGSALKFTSVLKLTTKQTSVRIPTGVLLGQRQYVFSIIARMRQGVDIYTTPLRLGDTSATAETLTALVTTTP